MYEVCRWTGASQAAKAGDVEGGGVAGLEGSLEAGTDGRADGGIGGDPAACISMTPPFANGSSCAAPI